MLVRSKIDRRFARFCRTGDPGALAFVFDRTAARLLHVALWLCRNRADADDLLQRTFLQAIALRARFEPGRAVLPWLIGLLSNQAHKLRRERDRRAASLPVVERAIDPVAEAAANELAVMVRAVRAKLSEPYRDVLELHLEQGLDAGEIAQRLGRPAGTVRTQLMRGLEMLRKKLPGGFLAGLAPVVVSDGLGAVRIEVMRAATDSMPLPVAVPGALVTAIGGVVVIKKLFVMLSILVILLGVVALRPWAPDSTASPRTAPGPVLAAVDAAKTPDVLGAAAPPAPAERQLLASPVAAPHGRTQPLEVEVLDDHQRPVEGAFVLFSADGVERLTENSSTASTVGCTDAQGKLHVADAPAAFCFVGAVQPGHGVATFKPTDSSGSVRLRLFTIDAVLRGRVELPDGSGSGGTKVELNQFLVLTPPNAGVNLGGAAASRVVDTDADGRFAIAVSRGWLACSLRASTSTNCSRAVTVHTDVENEIRDVRILMPGRVQLRGLVLDWRGRPVANVRVLANAVEASPTGERIGQIAVSDATGCFAVRLSDAGTYEVGAMCESGHPRSDCAKVQASVDGNPPVTLHLAEPATIEGRVTGIDGNHKLSVSAWLLPDPSFETQMQVADHGRFVLENLARGQSYSLGLFVDERLVVREQTIAGSGEVVELRNPAGEGAVAVELTGDGVAGRPIGERQSVTLVEVSAEGQVRDTLAEGAPTDGGVVFEHLRSASHAIAVLMIDGTERARSAQFAIDQRRVEMAIEVRPLGTIELEAIAEIAAGTMLFAKVVRGDGQYLLRGGAGRLRQGQPWRCTVQAGDYVLRVITEAPGRQLEAVDLPCRVFGNQTTRLRVP